jgi:hypothetical protein
MAAAVVIPTVTKLAVGEKHMGTPACGSVREGNLRKFGAVPRTRKVGLYL